MGHKKSFGLPLAVILLACFGASSSAIAATQAAGQASRLAGDWRTSPMTPVADSKPPQSAPEPVPDQSREAAPSSARLERMLLLLQPSAAQRQALDLELAALGNPASPQYRKWLAPAAFADAYSISAADASEVAAWLRSEGFQVAPLPAGRGWIEFSGTAGQVELAFHTRVDSLTAAGETRFSLAQGISVPKALSPVIAGLVSLDGSLATALLTPPETLKTTAGELAAETGVSGAQALTPRLAGQLLHFDTLRTAGVDGAGQSIAIVSRSNLNSGDVAAFRAAFGLPQLPVAVVLNGADPGLTSDQAEATLAASWAGAAAPAARIVVAPAATTGATDGADLSLAAIVDRALAHTVAVGYSTCEAALAPAHQTFYAALYRQAAAEGISVIAAAGDSGASACHAAGSSAPVSSGFAVNALASTPWNTAVGVAALEGASPSLETSALAAWPSDGALAAGYAGGGGSSAVYAMPGWQPAPSDSQPSGAAARNRLLPDLALPAAIDSAFDPGLAFCLSGTESGTGCTLVRSGGSSGAAALFAGIAALIQQKNGTQGNLAPHLDAMSSRSGVFTDVTQGSAKLSCVAGSPGCAADGQIGFAASTGYDTATGLGVVNANALVTDWAMPEATGTGLANVTNTTSSSQTINPSGSVVLSANVVSGNGGPAPTGTVTFQDITQGQAVATVALNIGSGETSTATVTVTGVLAQGGHQIEADYNGDTNYAPANSGPVVVEVQPSSTTTTVVPSTNTPAGGATFTVNATITSLNSGTGAVPPSGTLDFRLDGVSQGTKQVITGTPSTASITMTAPLTGGAHQIVGFYSGDNDYYNSTSNAVTVTVSKSAPAITLTPATTTPLAGSSLQITADISPQSAGGTAPTGTVTFTLDGTAVGTEAVTSGTPSTAVITITAPSVGGHTLAATYSGDTNYSSVTSSAVTITIAKVATTLALAPATTSPLGGSSLLATATVSISGSSAATPSGTVTFTMDGASQGTATLSGGTTATLSITVPASGSHTLQASYSGDSNFQAATSPAVTITVAKTSTTTVVSPSTTSPAAGAPVTLTAAITPSAAGAAQPTGSVTFTVDGVSAGVESVVAGSPSTASVTLSALTSGSHAVAATYSGDTNYASSVSAAVTVTVGKSPTTTVITPASLTPTAGGSLVVSAAITSSGPVSASPTGTVSFLMDGVAQGTGTVTSGSPAMATFTIPVVPVGSHVLTAAYSGDTSYLASTSASVAIAATKGATVTTVTATPPILAPGTAETLTAMIAPSAAASGTVYTLTGTVAFYDNGTTLLGTAAVASNTATLSGVPLPNNISHSITAIYSGDINWLVSTSPALALAATTLPDVVVLSSNASTASPGQALVLTVSVTPTSTPALGAEQNPTGNVVFYDGTTIIGTEALVAAPSGDSAIATLTTETLPGGQDTIYAAYLGDLYYDAENSNLLSLNVQDFTIVPSPSNPPTNLTIVQGTSGSASFVVTGLGGFNDSIQVVCQTPAQDNMTCTASPQDFTPPSTVTFVVQTFTPGQQATAALTPRVPPVWPRAAGGAALAVLGFFLLPFGRRARIFTRGTARRVAILVLLLAALGAAGIGCNSTTAVNGTGTPLGVATLKITASANVDNTVVSHSVYLTVNVVTPGSSQ